PILSIITYIPLLGALLIAFFVPKENSGAIKGAALVVALIDFFASIPLWIYFDPKGHGDRLFQFRELYEWIPAIGVKYSFAIDGIALLLILLTTLTGVLAIYSSFGAIEN